MCACACVRGGKCMKDSKNTGFLSLCMLAQDPHSFLSALMMCASAGPLHAQWGPAYQHSCPGYRPITQCQ